MKKMLSILMTLVMAFSLFCTAALAEGISQPEGGKKFESSWGMMNGLVDIVYEEEGYRVMVDLYNQENSTGTMWQYSCLYNEQSDSLVSVTSIKNTYTLNPDTLERAFSDYEYEGFDTDGTESVFSITADGALEWKDGHENLGQDLQFTKIGNFEGLWRNQEKDVYIEFHWQGLLDENQFCYNIYIGRGDSDLHLNGIYNPDTDKLECYDEAIDCVEAWQSGKPCDAVFQDLGGGRALYEAGGETIELEYDLLGPES